MYLCNKENILHLIKFTVPPLTAREGSFTDHIAEEMQRKFIKDMKTWECFFLNMFRCLQVVE